MLGNVPKASECAAEPDVTASESPAHTTISERTKDNEIPDETLFREQAAATSLASAEKGTTASINQLRNPHKSHLESGIEHANDERMLYRKVESRMASANWGDEKSSAMPESEVQTLDDAAERSLTLLFGGFSRSSRILWRAFFAAVNLASCIYIAAVPEIYRSSFNSAAGHANAS
eukprot:CAMPEP_0172203008 /NCGR_PEP_ID=MMETSP1050-20130122/31011_1 /TAXON_ID=233186 /ORGANISM="Cryptomonas curvata, Strain CCAP979/52" /LENGTH=175 /DNA_ID=CAMNT_0012881107 /DNA_START=178 /DNA_END=701 /DNA_ORIENTATION=-